MQNRAFSECRFCMKTLLVEEKNHVLKVTMNRPEVRNAFNPEMISEITKVFTDASNRHDLRAIVLSGAGKVFCAGADLNWMREMVNFSLSQNESDSHQLHAMFAAIADCACPVVCVVRGASFGGALGLMAASDVVIAEDKAQFCFSEVKLGLAPAVISEFVLRKCELGHVVPLMLTAQIFTVEQAQRAGLVHHVAGDDSNRDIDQVTDDVLAQICDCGPQAVRATKKLLRSLDVQNREAARAQTTKLIAQLRVGSEGQDGLKSFLEKKTPSWRS